MKSSSTAKAETATIAHAATSASVALMKRQARAENMAAMLTLLVTFATCKVFVLTHVRSKHG